MALKGFLFKICEAESDVCGCIEDSETPKDVEKIRAWKILRGLDYKALSSHPCATRYVAEFMLQIVLLGQFRHCEEVEPEPDPVEGKEQLANWLAWASS